MTPRQRRTTLIIGGLVAIGIATFFVLRAFNENLVFFYTPTQIASKEAPTNKNFRIGGMVVQNSLQREPGGLKVAFIVTDMVNSIPVEYAQGKLNDKGVFVASQVLAKHDENYMPPEAKSALDSAKASQEQKAKSLILDGKQ